MRSCNEALSKTPALSSSSFLLRFHLQDSRIEAVGDWVFVVTLEAKTCVKATDNRNTPPLRKLPRSVNIILVMCEM